MLCSVAAVGIYADPIEFFVDAGKRSSCSYRFHPSMPYLVLVLLGCDFTKTGRC